MRPGSPLPRDSLARLWQRLRGRLRGRPADEACTVTVSKRGVRVAHPRQGKEEIRWSELKKILMVTDGDGPTAPEVWLMLVGDSAKCSIPCGCEGYGRVFDIVSKYERFDFGGVLKAAASPGGEFFELWRRNG